MWHMEHLEEYFSGKIIQKIALSFAKGKIMLNKLNNTLKMNVKKQKSKILHNPHQSNGFK